MKVRTISPQVTRLTQLCGEYGEVCGADVARRHWQRKAKDSYSEKGLVIIYSSDTIGWIRKWRSAGLRFEIKGGWQTTGEAGVTEWRL